jgi:broad specificity phosphatase PhoE
MTRLLLCRHPAPGDTGALARALRGIELAAVYTSPFDRAREAALAIDAGAVVVDDLREIDFGEVKGLGFDELPPELQRGLLEAPARVRFPGGETYAELQGRVTAALADIVARHDGDTMAVVSHAGAIRAALAAWLLVADEAVFRIDQRHGAVNVIEFHDGTPLIRLVNGTTP